MPPRAGNRHNDSASCKAQLRPQGPAGRPSQSPAALWLLGSGPAYAAAASAPLRSPLADRGLCCNPTRCAAAGYQRWTESEKSKQAESSADHVGQDTYILPQATSPPPAALCSHASASTAECPVHTYLGFGSHSCPSCQARWQAHRSSVLYGVPTTRYEACSPWAYSYLGLPRTCRSFLQAKPASNRP